MTSVRRIEWQGATYQEQVEPYTTHGVRGVKSRHDFRDGAGAGEGERRKLL